MIYVRIIKAIFFKEFYRVRHYENSQKKNKLPQTIGLSFALFLITMIIGFYFNDIKAPDYLGLQPFMKSEAHFKDGSVKYFEDGAETSL